MVAAAVLWPWLTACSPAGPGASERPPPARQVLYLSTLGAAEDQRTMDAIRAGFIKNRARIGDVVLQAVPLKDYPGQDDLVAPQIATAVGPRAHSLVFAANMRLARLVQGVDAQTPIVFEGASDPRSSCLVDSLSSPGRNATGYTAHVPSAAKAVEAVADAFGSVQEVVVVHDGQQDAVPPCNRPPAGATAPHTNKVPPVSVAPSCQPGPASGPVEGATAELLAAARARGLRARWLRLCSPSDVQRLQQWLPLRTRGAPTVAVLVPMQYLFYSQSAALVQALGATGLPALYPRHSYVVQGGLMSLAPTTQLAVAERAVELAVRILAGEAPQRLPVQTPEGFEFHISASAAARQGLAPSALAWRRARLVAP